jgi:hypothetical protein
LALFALRCHPLILKIPLAHTITSIIFDAAICIYEANITTVVNGVGWRGHGAGENDA